MTTKNVVIKVGPTGKGFVEIDGERITNCRGVEVSALVGTATTVRLELVNVSVEVEADAEVESVTETTNIGSTSREYVQVGDGCD